PRDGFMIANERRQLTFERRQSLVASKTLNSFTLPAGNYEFPFTIHLDSSMTETITGFHHDYHSYKVQGIIERRYGKEFVLSQPIRVYKAMVFETSLLWPSFSMSIENQREESIRYTISIPDQNIPFGSTFPVEFWLTPLSKDIKLAAIEIQVLERHDLRIEATAAESVRSNVHFLTSKTTHVVFGERHDLTAENYETPDPELPDVEWHITKPVHLPRLMDACSQSIRLANIKIAHVLTTTIELRTLEGCVSTVRWQISLLAGNEKQGLTSDQITDSIPFDIFMSPIVLGEDGTVHGHDMQLLQGKNIPPPPYGAHTRDSAVGDPSAGVLTGWLPHGQETVCQCLGDVPSYESAVRRVT
ncbi:hypothetical protein N7523_004293, partial [Penicillium sp. IBT 18751x]